MHTFIEPESGVFCVGYYHPDVDPQNDLFHTFITLLEYKTLGAAAAAVNHLNGGQASFPTPQPKEILIDPEQHFKNGMAVVLALIAARYRSHDATLEVEYSPTMYRITRLSHPSEPGPSTALLTNFVSWIDAVNFLNGYGVKS